MSAAASASDLRATRRRRLRLALIVSAIVLPADLLVGYARARIAGSIPGEYFEFGPAGASILQGHWASTYVDPDVQSGSLELLPYGIAHVLGVHGTVGWTVFYVVLSFLATLLLAGVVLLFVPTSHGRWVVYTTLAVALLAVLGSIIPRAVFLGHPADVVIPLLWIASAHFAIRRRFVPCGVIIALSCGFEVWGVLGAPVIFLATAPRVWAAALAGLAVVAALYLPFIASGSFAMFGFHWRVDGTSIYGFFGLRFSDFPWSLRLAQAAFALLAGAGVAVLFRKRSFGPWAVPFAIIAARLLVDPLLLSYYWLEPASVALAALAAALYWRSWAVAVIALAVVVLTWLAPSIPLLAAALLFALAVGMVVVRRRIGPRVSREPAS